MKNNWNAGYEKSAAHQKSEQLRKEIYERLSAKAKAGGQPAAKPMPVPKAKKAPAYKAAAAVDALPKKAMPTYAKAVPIPPSHNLEWLTQHSTVDIQELVPEIMAPPPKAKVPALPGPLVSSPKGFKAYGAAMKRLNPPKPKPN